MKHIDNFSNTCIFLAKMMLHSEIFSVYSYSLKSVACIIAAFDILRSNSKTLSKESESFLRQWILFIIDESGFEADEINIVYSKVVDFYEKYEKISFINFNLNKNHVLAFD